MEDTKKAMEYRRLGGTGLKVSELCLGCMTFGRETDEKTAGKILDRFVEVGGNFLDTANVYAAGASEEILGRILGERRKDLIVATKVRFNANIFMGKTVAPNQIGLSRGHIMSEVEASLRRLKMDYIDLYQVHSWDFETPIEETMRALDDLVRHGKVRYIGASNFTAWQLMKSLWVSDKHNYARFDCLQPQYSLISREIEREILPLCRYEGVGVIPWSPLGGGFLTGKYRSGQRPPEDSRLAKMDMWNRLADERNYATLEAVEHVAKERGRRNLASRAGMGESATRCQLGDLRRANRRAERAKSRRDRISARSRGARGAQQGKRTAARVSRLDAIAAAGLLAAVRESSKERGARF